MTLSHPFQGKIFSTQVYDGIWGYNSLLSMAAVSCVFFPFSPKSLMAGVLNAVATVGVQAALRRNMDTVRFAAKKLTL